MADLSSRGAGRPSDGLEASGEKPPSPPYPPLSPSSPLPQPQLQRWPMRVTPTATSLAGTNRSLHSRKLFAVRLDHLEGRQIIAGGRDAYLYVVLRIGGRQRTTPFATVLSSSTAHTSNNNNDNNNTGGGESGEAKAVTGHGRVLSLSPQPPPPPSGVTAAGKADLSHGPSSAQGNKTASHATAGAKGKSSSSSASPSFRTAAPSPLWPAGKLNTFFFYWDGKSAMPDVEFMVCARSAAAVNTQRQTTLARAAALAALLEDSQDDDDDDDEEDGNGGNNDGVSPGGGRRRRGGGADGGTSSSEGSESSEDDDDDDASFIRNSSRAGTTAFGVTSEKPRPLRDEEEAAWPLSRQERRERRHQEKQTQRKQKQQQQQQQRSLSVGSGHQQSTRRRGVVAVEAAAEDPVARQPVEPAAADQVVGYARVRLDPSMLDRASKLLVRPPKATRGGGSAPLRLPPGSSSALASNTSKGRGGGHASNSNARAVAGGVSSNSPYSTAAAAGAAGVAEDEPPVLTTVQLGIRNERDAALLRLYGTLGTLHFGLRATPIAAVQRPSDATAHGAAATHGVGATTAETEGGKKEAGEEDEEAAAVVRRASGGQTTVEGYIAYQERELRALLDRVTAHEALNRALRLLLGNEHTTIMTAGEASVERHTIRGADGRSDPSTPPLGTAVMQRSTSTNTVLSPHPQRHQQQQLLASTADASSAGLPWAPASGCVIVQATFHPLDPILDLQDVRSYLEAKKERELEHAVRHLEILRRVRQLDPNSRADWWAAKRRKLIRQHREGREAVPGTGALTNFSFSPGKKARAKRETTSGWQTKKHGGGSFASRAHRTFTFDDAEDDDDNGNGGDGAAVPIVSVDALLDNRGARLSRLLWSAYTAVTLQVQTSTLVNNTATASITTAGAAGVTPTQAAPTAAVVCRRWPSSGFARSMRGVDPAQSVLWRLQQTRKGRYAQSLARWVVAAQEEAMGGQGSAWKGGNAGTGQRGGANGGTGPWTQDKGNHEAVGGSSDTDASHTHATSSSSSSSSSDPATEESKSTTEAEDEGEEEGERASRRGVTPLSVPSQRADDGASVRSADAPDALAQTVRRGGHVDSSSGTKVRGGGGQPSSSWPPHPPSSHGGHGTSPTGPAVAFPRAPADANGFMWERLCLRLEERDLLSLEIAVAVSLAPPPPLSAALPARPPTASSSLTQSPQLSGGLGRGLVSAVRTADAPSAGDIVDDDGSSSRGGGVGAGQATASGGAVSTSLLPLQLPPPLNAREAAESRSDGATDVGQQQQQQPSSVIASAGVSELPPLTVYDSYPTEVLCVCDVSGPSIIQQLALHEAKQTQRLLSPPLSPPDRRSSIGGGGGGGGDDRADPITLGSGAEGGGQASHTGNSGNRQRLVPVFFPCYATTAAAPSHALVSPTAPSGQPLLPSTGSSGRGGALLDGPCGWLRVVLSLSPNFSLTRLRALQKEQQQQQQQLGMPMTMMIPSMPGGVSAAARYIPPQCWLPNSLPNTRADGQPYPVANSSAAAAVGNATNSLQEQQQQQWVLTSQFTATDVQEASRTAHENSGTFPLDTASYDDGEAAAPMPAAFMPKAKPPSSIKHTGRGEGGDAAVGAGAEGELRGYAYKTAGSIGGFSAAHKGAANTAGVSSARAVSPVIANMEWAAVAAAASTASAAAAAAATASLLPSVSPYQRTQLSTPAAATQGKGVEGRDELLSSLPTAPTGGLVMRIDQVCASPPLSSSSVVSSSQTPSSARDRAGAAEGLTLGREYYAVLSFPSWSAVRGPSATAAAAEAAQSLPPALLFQARSSRAVRDAQGTSSSTTAKAGGVAAATAADRGSSGRHVSSAAATRLHGHGLRMSGGGTHKAPSDDRHSGVVAAWADAVYVLEACGPYVGLPLRVDILEAPTGTSATPSSSPPSNTATNSSGRDAAVPGDGAVSEAAGAVPRLVGSFVFHYSTLPFVGRHRFPLVPPLATSAATPHSTSTVPAAPSTDSPISHTATAAVVSGGGEAGARHARHHHGDGTHSGSSPLTITLAWIISPELQQQCVWRRLRRLHRESLVPFAVSEAGVRWVYDRVRHVTVDSSITANISSKSSLPLGRGGGEEEEEGENVEVSRGDGMNGWAHQHGWMGDASGVRSAAAGAAASPTTTVRPSEVAALTVFATPAGLTNANDTMQTQRSDDAQLRTLAMQPERNAAHLDDFSHASSTLPPRTSSQLHMLSQRRPPPLTLPQPALDRAVPRSQQGDDADGARREHTSPPRAQSDVVDRRGGIGSETQRGGGQYYRREGERLEGEGRLGGQGTGLQPLSTLEYNTKGMRSNSDSGSSSSSVGGGGTRVPFLPPARTPRVPADYLGGYPGVAQGRYLSGGHGRRYPQRAPSSPSPSSRTLHNSTSRSHGRRSVALLNSHSKRVHRPPPAEASLLRLRVMVLSLQNVRIPQPTFTTRTSSSSLRWDSGASLTPYVVVSYQGSSSSKDNYSLSLPAVQVSGGYNAGSGGGGASGALMYFTVEFSVPAALRLQLCHLVTVEVRDVLTRRVFGVAHVPVLIPAEGVDARGGRSHRLLSGRRRRGDGYEGGLTDSATESLRKSNAVAVSDGDAAVPPMFGETVTHVVPLCRYVRELQSTRAANHNDNSRHGIADTDDYHINGTNGHMRNSSSPFSKTAARSAGEEAIAPVVGEVTVLTTVLQRPSLNRLLAAHPVCITLTVLGARGLPCSHRPDWGDGSAILAAEPDAYVVVTVRRCEPLDMNGNYSQDETYAERYDEKNHEYDGSDEEDEVGDSAGFSSRQGNAEGPRDGVWSTREYRSLTIAQHRSPLWYLELPPLLCSCPNDHYTFTVYQADDDGFDVCLGECHITAQELLHRRLGTAEGGQQQGEEGRSEWGTSGSFTGGGGGAGQTDATFTSTPQTLVLPLGARSDALRGDGTHDGEEARVIAQDAESVMARKMMSGGGSRGSLVVEWSCVSAAAASAAAAAALLAQSARGVHRAVRAGLTRPPSTSFSSGYSAAVVVELQLDAATALALEMTARQRWWASVMRGTEYAPVVLAAISTESEGEERGGVGGDSGSFLNPGHRTFSVSHSEGLSEQYYQQQQHHLSYNSGYSRGSTMPGYKIVTGTLQLDSAVVYHTYHRHHQHDGRQSSSQQSISRDGTSFSESSCGDSETAFVSMNATFPSSLVIPFSLRSPPSPIRIELWLRYPNDDEDDNAHRDGAASAAHLSSSSYASFNYAGRASNTSQLKKLSTSTSASAAAVNTLVPSDVFLGEVTLHAASLTPCASPLQDPAPSTLLLRPRRDPRYRTSDVQRANRFAAGLGTVSLRAAVYPLRVYEARMRHQAQQRGWKAQLMVAVQDATDFESEGVYGVEVRCEGTGECRRSRVVRNRNPRFRETFAFTLFSATEVVEVRLLEWPGRDEAEEPCVVAVANFTVEAREEKAEGSSSCNMVDSAMVEEQHNVSGISTGAAAAAALKSSSVLQPSLVHTAWLTLQPVDERRDVMGSRVGGGSGGNGDGRRARRMVSPSASSFSAAGVAPKLLLRWRVRVCSAPGRNTSTVNPVSAVGTRGGLVGTQQGGVSSRQQRSMVPTPPPPAAIRHPRQDPHNAAGSGGGSAGRRRGDTQLQWSDDGTQDRPSAANGISQSAESAAAGYPYALSPPTPPPSSRNHGFNTPPTSLHHNQQYVSADTQRARTQTQAGQSTSRPSVSFTSAPTLSVRLTPEELRQPLVLNVLWWSGELLSFLGTGSSTARDVIRFCAARCRRSFTVRGDEGDVDSLSLRPLSMEHRGDEDGGYRGAGNDNDDGVNGSSSWMVWLPQDQPLLLYVRNGDYLQVGRQEAAVATRGGQPMPSGDVERREDENSICVQGRRVEAVDRMTDVRRSEQRNGDRDDALREGYNTALRSHAQERTPQSSNSHVRLVAARLSTAPLHMSKAYATPVRQQRRLTWLTRRQTLAEVNAAVLQQFARHAKEAFLTCKHTSNSSSLNPITPASSRVVSPLDSDSQLAALPTGVRCVVITFLYESVTALPVQLLVQWVQRHRDSLSGFCRPVLAAVRQDFHVMERVFGAAADDAAHTHGQQHNDNSNNNTNDFNGISSSSESVSQRQRELATDGRGGAAGSLTLVDAAELLVQGSAASLYAFLCFLSRSTTTSGAVKAEQSAALKGESGTGGSQSPRSSVASAPPPSQSLMVVEEVVGWVPVLRRGVFVQAVNVWEARQVWVRAAQQMPTKEEERGRGGESAPLTPTDEGQGGGGKDDDSTALFLFTPPLADSKVEERRGCAGGDKEGVLPGYHAMDLREGQGGC